jgi:hypothetical protein
MEKAVTLSLLDGIQKARIKATFVSRVILISTYLDIA